MKPARLATGMLLCALACVPRAIVHRTALCGERQEHRVAAGETLYRIAVRYRVSVESLGRENRLQDVSRLEPGQMLCIPETLRAEAPGSVPPGNATGPTPGSALDPSREQSRAGSGLPGSGVVAPDRSAPRFHWPLRGVLYARFGKHGGELVGEFHDGIDLAAPRGTPVHAAGDGKVLFAGEQKGYGLVVIIQHVPGWVTVYAHGQAVEVREGEVVTPRTVVATVGESGHTTGPHLHFELRHDGMPVDPIPYLGAP